MASQVRFDPPGVDGLVAAGTTLAAAAERLGVPMALSCGGKGECTSCAVEVIENPFSLSEVTPAEQAMLGQERISSSVRLGCQATIRDGDCVLRVVGKPEDRAGAGEQATGERPEGCATSPIDDVKDRIMGVFAQLPSSEEVATTIDKQVKAAGGLIETFVAQPIKAGEEFLSSILGSPKTGESSDKPPKQDE